MPSPFPGMDPFLEDPGLFPGFHNNFITYMEHALQETVPEPYYAQTGERVWVEIARRVIEPDVNVMQGADETSAGPERGGGTAVLDAVVAEPVVISVLQDEHREPFVEIRARHGGDDRLITTVEVLSLSNKTPGEHGREAYLRKQQEVLASAVHLVEIDLLRGGEPTTAVPWDLARTKTGAFDYHVCIHRSDRPTDYFVYPIWLAQRLPTIALPLLPEHKPVALDLQAIFERCYETGPYRRRIRYDRVDVTPKLPAAQITWVRQLLQDKGYLSKD
jgi:Protein of unknown function (DUF4058)